MSDSPLHIFVNGIMATSFFIVGLFFLRFLRRTGDRLFLNFSAAFLLMAVGQCTSVLLGLFYERHPAVYLLRLAAFLLIIIGILQKNLAARLHGGGERHTER